MIKNTRTRLCSHTRNTLCTVFFQPLSSITHGSGGGDGGRGGSFVFSTAREWHVYVISFPLTYIIHKVSQKVSIKKTAIYLFKKRRKKREERRAKRVSSMTIHARSQIVERNDDQDSTQTTTRWRFRREREREREDGIARRKKDSFLILLRVERSR